MITKEKQKYRLAARLRRTNEGWECAVMKNIPETKVRKTFVSDEFSLHDEKGVINVIPGDVKEQPRERKGLTDYQYFLYLRAFNGIRIYKKEKINKMGPWEQDVIKTLNRKCHEVLTDFLERALIVISNRVLRSFGVTTGNFFKPRDEAEINWSNKITAVTKESIEVWDTQEDFNLRLSFRDLFVTRDMLINELIRREILPANFRQLTTDKRDWEQLINEPIDL